MHYGVLFTLPQGRNGLCRVLNPLSEFSPVEHSTSLFEIMSYRVLNSYSELGFVEYSLLLYRYCLCWLLYHLTEMGLVEYSTYACLIYCCRVLYRSKIECEFSHASSSQNIDDKLVAFWDILYTLTQKCWFSKSGFIYLIHIIFSFLRILFIKEEIQSFETFTF